MNGEGETRAPAAIKLRQLFQQRYYPAHTDTAEPFVVDVRIPSVMITMEELEQKLLIDFVSSTGQMPPAQALRDTVAFAAAVAVSGRTMPASLRVAPGKDGSVYLDLGRRDGACVQLNVHGWRVTGSPPALFRRTTLTGELPLPAESGYGSADHIRDLVNIPGRDEWALYVACRIASLIPGVTHPVEIFSGPSGSAKTTVTRMTASWVDPMSSWELSLPVPRDGRSWATMAGSTYVAPVDNLSGIPVWWSDLLCKSASGDGWVDRALYTDGRVYTSSFRNVVLLNGITLGQVRGDLADRAIIHELSRPGRYLDDVAVASMWRGGHSGALGWLLDQAVMVLREMTWGPQLQTNDRLNRFQQVAGAVDRLWRTGAMGYWSDNRLQALTELAEDDIVAVAVMAAITQPWTGTPAELVSLLTMRGGLGEPERGKSWTPSSLGRRLTRAQDALASLGWQIRRTAAGRGTDRRRRIEIAPPGFALAGWVNGHGIANMRTP